MPRNIHELENDNWLMFDLLFRHQVYLEGVKSAFGGDYQAMLRDLYAEFARFLALNQYDTIDQFTKGELDTFIYKFKLAQARFYSHYTDDLIKLLQEFVGVDLAIHKEILQEVTAKTPEQANQVLKPVITAAAYGELTSGLQADYEYDAPGYKLTEQYQLNQNASGIYGVGIVAGDEDSNHKLWLAATGQPMPASGTYLLDAIQQFGVATNTAIDATIRKGYGNAWTKDQLQSALLGTDSSYAGGLFKTLADRMLALVATGVQHLSNEVQGAVASIYFERYQWVSIMDNVTTVICRSRNGIVYIFGSGPFPPAHWFCRSKIVPIVVGTKLHDGPATFYDWLVTQPEWILADMLGAEDAAAIKNGGMASMTFAQVRSVKPLTLTQFSAKLKYILGAE